MFEQTPPNLPISKEPEDILEKVLPSAPAPAAPPRPPQISSLPKETMTIETPHQGMKRLIFVLGIVLGLAVVGGSSWFFIRKMVSSPTTTTETPTPPAPVEPFTPSAPEIVEPVAPPVIPEPVAPEPPTIPPDTDGDGLSDAAEAQLGTNPNLIDSDNDGLTDFEEINIYHTKPLDPDSDGDKYLDGKEVRGGYDPNVAGK